MPAGTREVARVRFALVPAREEAGLLDHNFVDTEHLLLGLVREGQGVAARVLKEDASELARVREAVIGLLTASRDPGRAHGEPASAPATAGTPPSRRPRPPRCRHCPAESDRSARARRIAVPDDAGGPPITTTVVYCWSCGRDLVVSVDRDAPAG